MAERLHQKLARQNAASPDGAPDAAFKPPENPEVVAKINKFREENPRYSEYLKGLSRERLENMAILRKIDSVEQTERIRDATARKLDAWLESRPEEAQKIAAVVAKVAPEQQGATRSRMIKAAVQREGLRPVQAGTGQKV